jgi:hypothetical protein
VTAAGTAPRELRGGSFGVNLEPFAGAVVEYRDPP